MQDENNGWRCDDRIFLFLFRGWTVVRSEKKHTDTHILEKEARSLHDNSCILVPTLLFFLDLIDVKERSVDILWGLLAAHEVQTFYIVYFGTWNYLHFDLFLHLLL